MALCNVREERRLIEPASIRENTLRLPEVRPLGNATRHEFTDRLHLRARVDRANIGVLIHRITDAECGHTVLQSSNEIFGDRLLHQESTPRAADLALIEEDAVDDALHRLVECRILKDNVRRLATKL